MIFALVIYAIGAIAVWTWAWRNADHDLCGMGCLMGLLWPLVLALMLFD